MSGMTGVMGGVVVGVSPDWRGRVDSARVSVRESGILAALAARDPSAWGPAARAEASIRLGWLDAPERSRATLPELAELLATCRARGLDRVVLAGMGGSSLAPEVIAAVAGVELVTLDSTDPSQVRAALSGELSRTVAVVSSKSGGTIETDSHRRAIAGAFEAAGLSPAEQMVVVTDPGSPFAALAAEAGITTVLADPNVGGRYSALTAFGLTPTALAGVDPAALLASAARAQAAEDAGESAGAALGAVLTAAVADSRNKLVLWADPATHPGFGDWAEQLVAESTGKDGVGLLPVVVSSTQAPEWRSPAADVVRVAIGAGADSGADAWTDGPLGGLFWVWEHATAVVSRLLRIDPFNQPNVQESKDLTGRLLQRWEGEGALPADPGAALDGPIEIRTAGGLDLAGASLDDALRSLAEAVPERGYLAVMAYLDRHAEAAAADLRDGLAALSGRPVTFGWGPRFLHSTGQYHKGGPQTGAFLQITGAVDEDLEVPGRPWTFATLCAAQAAGDREALAGRGRPVLHLHLRDRATGLAALAGALTRVGSQAP